VPGHGSLWLLLQAGGIVTIFLLAVSVFSIAVIIERILFYRRMARTRRQDLLNNLRQAVKDSTVAGFADVCRRKDTPVANVILAGISLKDRDEKAVAEAMARQTAVETARLERLTDVVGTIGSTAVYVGLFGTVLGIIRAFSDISQAGVGDISIVIAGIAEALVCTATGLWVAIPAVIAYNFFMKAVDRFVAEMDLSASEVLEVVRPGRRW
jgi:biopolymer transport protein ExbB/TolQ